MLSTTVRGVSRSAYSCTLLPEGTLLHCIRARCLAYPSEELAAFVSHAMKYRKVRELVRRGLEEFVCR
jgi:hypothetical protein